MGCSGTNRRSAAGFSTYPSGLGPHETPRGSFLPSGPVRTAALRLSSGLRVETNFLCGKTFAFVPLPKEIVVNLDVYLWIQCNVHCAGVAHRESRQCSCELFILSAGSNGFVLNRFPLSEQTLKTRFVRTASSSSCPAHQVSRTGSLKKVPSRVNTRQTPPPVHETCFARPTSPQISVGHSLER